MKSFVATEHHFVTHLKYDEAGHWTKTMILLLLDPLGAVLHISLARPSGYFAILMLLLFGESYTILTHPSRSLKIAAQLPIFEGYRQVLDEWNCDETIACPSSLLAIEFR